MNIFTKQIEIEDLEGFTLNDIFNRRELGERLMSFMEMGIDPSVILLDGAWGSGKSTFIKQWRGLLKNNDFPVIYFDAFENDYVEDVFSSLASEIIAFSARPGTETHDDFVGKAISACKVLIPHVARRVLEKKTGITQDDLEAAKNAGKGFQSALQVDESIRERLTARSNEKKCLEEFKQALSKLAEDITIPEKTDGESTQTKKHKPLIFIIDELDRCKPTYALNFLEAIKHFYSVKNVNFVLVTNMKQLENIVKCVYGTSESSNYLEKFYDLRFSLNNNNRGTQDNNSVLYITKLVGSGPIAYVKDLINNNNIELTTCGKIASLFSIISILKDDHFDPITKDLSYYLCFLKVIDNDFYCRIKNKEISFEELKQSKHFVNNGNWLELFIEGCLSEQPSEQASGVVKRYTTHNILDRKQIIPYHCDFIDDFSALRNWYPSGD